ncbi:MAG: hypothetical protein R3F34_13790 [Planctomycetota bacterium]
MMLYELLTGTKTFDVKRALATGFDELLRQIREVDPALPSTRVSSLGDTATTVASSRGSDATTLSKRLKGDLDRRHARAREGPRAALRHARRAAEDVQRFLANEPVEAAPRALPTACGSSSCGARRPSRRSLSSCCSSSAG